MSLKVRLIAIGCSILGMMFGQDLRRLGLGNWETQITRQSKRYENDDVINIYLYVLLYVLCVLLFFYVCFICIMSIFHVLYLLLMFVFMFLYPF